MPTGSSEGVDQLTAFENDPHRPLIVGVGASAGGLEAFLEFVKGLSEGHGLVVILVQHLDPDHESLMPELVAKRTSSPVHSVTAGTTVEPGHIYLMPPGYEMSIEGSTLNLLEFAQPRGLRRPISRFFASMAEAHGENCVAVILSGTGSDGTEGAKQVKEAGGIVLIQDQSEAKYDGMPQSAIDAQVDDMILKAADMFDVIRDLREIRTGLLPAIRSDTEILSRITRHVKYRTGHDFENYKPATLLRRIAVRMSACGIDEASDYLRFLVEDKAEADRLFKDLLINVTSFFRDTNHFEKLQTQVIPKLVDHAVDTGHIRIWVPGCSTGQEAYTIGILVHEELEKRQQFAQVSIFATDIDGDALRVGRLGIYSQDIAEQVPEEYLRRYFVSRTNGYEVSSVLRETVRFSHHSFVKDPPFSKIDLVSCRNVLIYMNEILQEVAMRVFQYAIRPHGFLFIGPSENPKPVDAYFEELAARARIFARKPGQAKPLNLPDAASAAAVAPRARDAQEHASVREANFETLLRERHLPPHIHIDGKRNILFVSPKAIEYLSLKPGVINANLIDLLHPDVVTPFRYILNMDFSETTSVEREYSGELDGKPIRFVLSADRLGDGSTLLVLRDGLDTNSERVGAQGLSDEPTKNYIADLEAQLDKARGEVTTTVEELETSNEELKSSNEEMMSMNEELQSANEELSTINDELQDKVRALKEAHDDISNFMRGTNVAIVFLTRDLHLRAYSPAAEGVFSFTENDIGRAVEEFSAAIEMPKLLKLSQQTIEDGKERVEVFPSRTGIKTFRVRLSPYLDNTGTIQGVIFAVDDITKLTDALSEARNQKTVAEAALAEVEQLYDVSPQAMTLIDEEYRYMRVNPKMAEINGVSAIKHIGKTIREIIPDVAETTEKMVAQIFETGELISNMRIVGYAAHQPDNERSWDTDWYPVRHSGKIVSVGVNVRDVTDQAELASNLKLVMNELEHRVKNMLANVASLVGRATIEADTDRPILEKLRSRIDGLAKTHLLLTASQWTSASIYDVFRPETVEVFGTDRVTLKGPDIQINARSVLALGMTVHELVTNAAKYGAFANDKGQASLTWKRVDEGDGERLLVRWEERGGPAVQKSERSGFGSKLMKSTIEGSLGGELEFIWEPQGLICVIDLDFKDITKLAEHDYKLE